MICILYCISLSVTMAPGSVPGMLFMSIIHNYNYVACTCTATCILLEHSTYMYIHCYSTTYD